MKRLFVVLLAQVALVFSACGMDFEEDSLAIDQNNQGIKLHEYLAKVTINSKVRPDFVDSTRIANKLCAKHLDTHVSLEWTNKAKETDTMCEWVKEKDHSFVVEDAEPLLLIDTSDTTRKHPVWGKLSLIQTVRPKSVVDRYFICTLWFTSEDVAYIQKFICKYRPELAKKYGIVDEKKEELDFT